MNIMMAEQGRNYLEELCIPPDTYDCEYSDLQHLEESVDHAYKCFIANTTQSPFLVVKNLPPEQFEKHQDSLPGIADYNSSLQLLVLTMPSYPHESASADIEELIISRAKDSGIRRELIARRHVPSSSPGRTKQADCSWVPKHPPPGRSFEWPSIAVEVGYSESREKLKGDMEFWLNRSDDVQMAITDEIKKTSGKILVTLWRRGTPIPPQTAANPGPEAVQEVIMERGKASQGPIVSGDDNLTIPFEDVMLRPAVAQQGERDFVLTRQELLEMAGDVWYTMDNM